jgi:hypothetical protein
MNTPGNNDRRAILSTLWIFVMFNYLYADLLMMIINPAAYQKAAAKMSGPRTRIRGTDGARLLCSLPNLKAQD